jgi:hypothetical protein
LAERVTEDDQPRSSRTAGAMDQFLAGCAVLNSINPPAIQFASARKLPG